MYFYKPQLPYCDSKPPEETLKLDPFGVRARVKEPAPERVASRGPLPVWFSKRQKDEWHPVDERDEHHHPCDFGLGLCLKTAGDLYDELRGIFLNVSGGEMECEALARVDDLPRDTAVPSGGT
jgi:hypothetical protein